jgi:hypothetical protein
MGIVLANTVCAGTNFIMRDSFNVPTGTASDFNLQTNQAARQAGSVVGVTYSDVSANIIGGTQVYLTQTEAYDSAGVLNMRSLIDANGSLQIASSAAGINEDLAPQLAGQNYTISYAGLMIDRVGNAVGNPNIESWYQGFSLGGSNLPYEPTHVTTDLGFAMYSHGAALIYADGVLQYAAIIPGFSVGGVYGVQIEVDEVAQTASLSIDAGGIITDMGTYSVSFEAGEVTREMMFNNRVFTYDTLPNNDSWDVWTDAQVNNLQILDYRAEPFPAVPDPQQVVVWAADMTAQTNTVGAGLFADPFRIYNVTGTFGDFSAFSSYTADLQGWVPFYEDPNSLIPAVGTPHVVEGNGELDGTSYLDTLTTGSDITLNSSMGYLNGMAATNMLSGVTINSNMNYTLNISVSENATTVNTGATFTAAMTVGSGADVTNVANAVSNSYVQVAESGLNGITNTISGSDLFAAKSSGPVNFMMHHVNTTPIPGFPGGVAPGDVANEGLVSQVNIAAVQLIETYAQRAGDVNKDGVVDLDDLSIAQLYLDGNGGLPAGDRQSFLVSIGNTPAEALNLLNLTDFDMDADNDFDAADVAAINSLVPPLALVLGENGGAMRVQWSSRGASKVYDLESRTNLVSGSWAAYNDGLITYTNLTGDIEPVSIESDSGKDSLFFRVIER